MSVRATAALNSAALKASVADIKKSNGRKIRNNMASGANGKKSGKKRQRHETRELRAGRGFWWQHRTGMKAAEDSRTPRRWRGDRSAPSFRKVLECGCPLPLFLL